MIKAEAARPNPDVIRRKRSSVRKIAAGIVASMAVTAEYLLTGGASYDANKLNTNPSSTDFQRELSPGGDLYFPKAPLTDRRPILLFTNLPLPKKTPSNESPPAHTITAPDPSPQETSSQVTQSSDEAHDPMIDYAKIDELVAKMEKRPDVFSKGFIEGFSIYDPAYEAVGAKYGISPLLLAVIADNESGQGGSIRAYDGRSAPYVGMMQRNPEYWNDAYVDGATKGLEYLADFPQRHPGDWREIAFTGRFLYDHMKKYLMQGASKKEALIFALGRYNNPASGYERYLRSVFYEKILTAIPDLNTFRRRE